MHTDGEYSILRGWAHSGGHAAFPSRSSKKAVAPDAAKSVGIWVGEEPIQDKGFGSKKVMLQAEG